MCLTLYIYRPLYSLKLVLLQRDSEGEEVKRIEITELSQMLDYSQPHAPGTLSPVSLDLHVYN